MPFDLNTQVLSPEKIAAKWECSPDNARVFLREHDVPAMLEVPFVNGTTARYYSKDTAEKYFEQYKAWRKRRSPQAEQGTKNLHEARANMQTVINSVRALGAQLNEISAKVDRMLQLWETK